MSNNQYCQTVPSIEAYTAGKEELTTEVAILDLQA
jgi:hypothetical protein